MNSNEFELRLSSNLRAIGEAGLRPVDAMATAESVITAGQRRRLPLATPQTFGGVRLVWIAALLLALLLALLAAIAGSRLLLHGPAPLQPLTVISAGALYTGQTDSQAPTLLGSATDPVDRPLPPGTRTPDFKAARWSPDGRFLALAVGQEAGDTFWHGVSVFDASGGLIAQLQIAADFAWAPDSRHLLLIPLYPTTDSSPRLLDVDELISGSDDQASLDRAKLLAPPQAGIPLAAGWQAEGNAVMVLLNVTVKGLGFESDPNGTVSVWVTDPVSGNAYMATSVQAVSSAAVSPDGHAVAFATGNELGVVRLDGTPPCRMPVDVGSPIAWPWALAWTADGRQVAAAIGSAAKSELDVMTAECAGGRTILSGSTTGSLTYENFLDGGDPLVVTRGELSRGPIEWSSDGRWIYYRGLTDAAAPSGQPTLDLRRIPADGGESELVESRVEWFDLGLER